MTQVETIAGGFVLCSVAFSVYAYLGYPALLWALGLVTRRRLEGIREDVQWPLVSITACVYNEEHQIDGLIKSLLALDYPKDRIQILIISDASTDRTDEIVRGYADQGVDLLRLGERGGKTKAENAAVRHLRGEIVINTDASIRVASNAIKPLVATFADPEVGLASGRDVSVSAGEKGGNFGESSYVGYEMAIRDLETRVSGIVGASGCFYAIRPKLHRTLVPESLSRDFAAALHTREQGFRAVSVPGAVSQVPRTSSLHQEYRRKVRTITRGMETLYFKKALLNPFRFGLFSWMLLSHKVFRWLVPWAAFAGLLGVAILSASQGWARVVLAGSVLFLGLAWIGWRRGEDPRLPKIFAVPAFLVAGNLAVVHATKRVLRGDRNPVWEPTRRKAVDAS
ncbi:MAG: glycosyltransferase [Gemmatimonadota bacterium]